MFYNIFGDYMEGQFSRTEKLIGKGALDILSKSRVAVFGIGGVGGYVVEALVRGGIGELDLFDSDAVALSNLNRQIIATHQTLGRPKVEVAKERALSINPNIKINTHKVFFLPENSSDFDFSGYDYIVDAIDTVSGKIELCIKAKEVNVPIISCMGTGNKMDPTKFLVSDISKTEVCPLAKAMRLNLRKRGINHLKVVYSKEIPIKTDSDAPSSNSFVPASAGLIIAGEVIKDLIKR